MSMGSTNAMYERTIIVKLNHRLKASLEFQFLLVQRIPVVALTVVCAKYVSYDS